MDLLAPQKSWESYLSMNRVSLLFPCGLHSNHERKADHAGAVLRVLYACTPTDQGRASCRVDASRRKLPPKLTITRILAPSDCSSASGHGSSCSGVGEEGSRVREKRDSRPRETTVHIPRS